jgi:transposase
MTKAQSKHQSNIENSLTGPKNQEPALDFLSVITELKDENTRLNTELEEAQAKIRWYEEQLRLSAQKRFGKSADTIIIENQMSFFNEPEVTQRPVLEEPTVEVATHNRRKRGLNRDSFDDLPVERIEYDLTEDEKSCPVCDSPLHQMKEEVRQELKVIPAKIVRVEHVRKVYACRHCQEHEIKTPIITAKAPNPVFPGSFASASLLAYILYQKFATALPLYRQEQTFRHFGVELSRQTMSNWIIKGSERYLEPLYRLMKKHLEKENFLMADEIGSVPVT